LKQKRFEVGGILGADEPLDFLVSLGYSVRLLDTHNNEVVLMSTK
jgi:hypothetical protein